MPIRRCWNIRQDDHRDFCAVQALFLFLIIVSEPCGVSKTLKNLNELRNSYNDTGYLLVLHSVTQITAIFNDSINLVGLRECFN